MAFRRYDHIDEIIKITRAIGTTEDVRSAKAKIASFQWLIAHDGPATMGEYPGDDGQADRPQEADRGSPVGGPGPAEPAHAVGSGSPLAKR
jgi:hypothetical protein